MSRWVPVVMKQAIYLRLLFTSYLNANSQNSLDDSSVMGERAHGSQEALSEAHRAALPGAVPKETRCTQLCIKVFVA